VPEKASSGLYGAREDNKRQRHRQSGWVSLHPDQSEFTSINPLFVREMLFLWQPSQSILAWDKHRNILDCIPPWLGLIKQQIMSLKHKQTSDFRRYAYISSRYSAIDINRSVRSFASTSSVVLPSSSVSSSEVIASRSMTESYSNTASSLIYLL